MKTFKDLKVGDKIFIWDKSTNSCTILQLIYDFSMGILEPSEGYIGYITGDFILGSRIYNFFIIRQDCFNKSELESTTEYITTDEKLFEKHLRRILNNEEV